MARHEHAHEVFGFAVRLAAGDDHLVDVLVIEVADRALDEVAFLVDEARRLALQGEVAHALPQAQQVFEVALDLLLGARRAGRADDEPHALRHFELGGDGLEALAVLRLRDLARDAAATGGVRHQDGVAAGERQVGGEGGALVAALFLDDLHQDHLAALDDLLDLVAARAAARARGQLFERVLARADLLDALHLDRGGVGLDLTDAAVFARRGLRLSPPHRRCSRWRRRRNLPRAAARYAMRSSAGAASASVRCSDGGVILVAVIVGMRGDRDHDRRSSPSSGGGSPPSRGSRTSNWSSSSAAGADEARRRASASAWASTAASSSASAAASSSRSA